MTVQTRPTSMTQQRTVYHYQNPLTGEHIASLLSPDHQEMICLQQGEHVNVTTFGTLGILAAIIWFPFGNGLCLLARRVKCKRHPRFTSIACPQPSSSLFPRTCATDSCVLV
ncbi:hypothetical protein EDB19DRAFT_1777246 [Suillus lakei]|nr:hypothetical protein EDB19DRAFT_1777246 [Suillus lakei]